MNSPKVGLLSRIWIQAIRAEIRYRLSQLLLHIVLATAALVALFPLLWMLSTSFKIPESIFTTPPQYLPSPLTLDNYLNLFTYIPFARQFFNTLLVCMLIVMGQLLFSSMGAYAFARLRFPGRDTLFVALLATMMIPFPVTLIPSFIIVRELGWVNTYMALIAPYFLGSALATFFLRQFMLRIPVELEEAARIDGASHFVIFTRIVLPLIRPALATLGVFAFVFFWNDFLWPLVVTNSEERKVLTVGIATLAQSYYGTDWGVVMAGAVITVLPLIGVFFLAQRQFIEAIAITGIKG